EQALLCKGLPGDNSRRHGGGSFPDGTRGRNLCEDGLGSWCQGSVCFEPFPETGTFMGGGNRGGASAGKRGGRLDGRSGVAVAANEWFSRPCVLDVHLGLDRAAQRRDGHPS